jgi:magnesium-transporting ATPase (P-type)
MCGVDEKQLLLRGCLLANTAEVAALVVYTGFDTKMMLNRNPGKFKFSLFERHLNNMVMMLFLINFLVCATLAIFHNFNTDCNVWAGMWEINATSFGDLMLNFVTHYIAFSYMIPLSLYVTLEVVALAQATLIAVDKEMVYHHKNPDGTDARDHAKVKNSWLNSELGTVQFICTDKTGTLTQNQMELSSCSIGAVCCFLLLLFLSVICIIMCPLLLVYTVSLPPVLSAGGLIVYDEKFLSTAGTGGDEEEKQKEEDDTNETLVNIPLIPVQKKLAPTTPVGGGLPTKRDPTTKMEINQV